MNDPISWDPSLVKKYGSSNHYKLLNQLRNEVKKYPLNKKNKSSSTTIKHTDPDIKKKSNNSDIKANTSTNSSNQSYESYSNISTISFNNAKNFSIYNQTNNNNIVRQNENIKHEQTKSKDDSTFQSFNDRLNQIDMK